MVGWATTRAVWSATDGTACREHQDGAFIAAKWDYLRLGPIPVAERWRVDITEAIGGALIIWLSWINTQHSVWTAFSFFVAYPALLFILLHGRLGSACPLSTRSSGGVFVSLLTAVLGIVFSLPSGVPLALGRRSPLRAVRLATVVFIEFARGVPFMRV
jgi:general L-amino acid transport system permease protein